MFYTGMVSVTFRKFSVDEIVNITAQAGLDGIEWGGDIHVPHGDFGAAEYAAGKCKAAGLKCFSYGSYYRAGQKKSNEEIIETANILGAPNIRIWAGVKGSAETLPEERKLIVDDIVNFAAKAAEYNKTVSFEYHGGTLNDEPDSGVNLLKEAGNLNNLYLYWQPNQFKDINYNLDALNKIKKYLLNIHVFAWYGSAKLPLIEHRSEWRKYLDIIKNSDRDHGLFLEFSPDDTAEMFLADAEFLKNKLI